MRFLRVAGAEKRKFSMRRGQKEKSPKFVLENFRKRANWLRRLNPPDCQRIFVGELRENSVPNQGTGKDFNRFLRSQSCAFRTADFFVLQNIVHRYTQMNADDFLIYLCPSVFICGQIFFVFRCNFERI